MKTKLLGLIAIAIIAIAIIGCKGDESTGGTQEQPVGSVTIGGKTIPIYKDDDVSDADAKTTVVNIQQGFSNPELNVNTPAYIAANVTRIEITKEGSPTFIAGVLKVRANISANAIAINLDNIYNASLSVTP
jgi:hypothetical protein